MPVGNVLTPHEHHPVHTHTPALPQSTTHTHTQLLFEASYSFIVNKGFDPQSKAFKLINQLNADAAYHRYLLLCKIDLSLCQINKSAEVDYYKVRCSNVGTEQSNRQDYRIIIPRNFSKATSDYLERITRQYNFSDDGGFIVYDELRLFDVRAPQPEIDLYKIRFDSASTVQSMVKYIEVSNVFRASDDRFLIFIADNALLVQLAPSGGVVITINRIPVEIATIFFNDAISFVPCFKYADSDDVIFFTSRSIHYLVDKGGQFSTGSNPREMY